jgi:hypothetical protein
MELNEDRHKANHQTGNRFGAIPTLPGDRDANADGVKEAQLAASEVMNIVFEVTRTSTDIYELVADMVESLAGPAIGQSPDGRPLAQQHHHRLLRIFLAIQETQGRIQILDPNAVAIHQKIFDSFLKDCNEALVTFKEASRDIAGIIATDDRAPCTMTVSDILVQTMERLETCSEIVSGLPEKGMAVFFEFLVETAFNLKYRAGDLIGESAGNS